MDDASFKKKDYCIHIFELEELLRECRHSNVKMQRTIAQYEQSLRRMEENTVAKTAEAKSMITELEVQLQAAKDEVADPQRKNLTVKHSARHVQRLLG
ncbi:hypothetical protein AAVH_17870 [Aphelenchoides avenae]|nr:hypothetical protein AAVH_17870 [Aphelenchus avenae]